MESLEKKIDRIHLYFFKDYEAECCIENRMKEVESRSKMPLRKLMEGSRRYMMDGTLGSRKK